MAYSEKDCDGMKVGIRHATPNQSLLTYCIMPINWPGSSEAESDPMFFHEELR